MRFLQYFGLKYDPFRKDIPVEELFEHQDGVELRSRLDYLQATRGIGLVVGEPGTGKTTALRAHLDQLSPSLYRPCYFALSTLNVREFLNGLAVELGETPAHQRVQTIGRIQHAIGHLYGERKLTPVIVLDEMHLASNAIFEELRLILNFAMDSKSPYILLLVAQPPIRTKLTLNVHLPLRQRITVKHTMRGLLESETGDYLSSRMKLAGSPEAVFSSGACSAIYSLSNGIPRVVNSLATHCLIYACQQDERCVDEEAVYQASRELQI